MPDRNSLFTRTKTRRFVSPWTMQQNLDVLLPRAREFADVFDQIVCMCGHPTPTGLPTDWPAEARTKLYRELRAMGISALNDYAGPFAGWGEEAMRDPSKIAPMVRLMADECEATGADGVDIDFEGWPGEARFFFNDFMAELSAELHRRGKLLSVCAGTVNTSARRESGIGFIDPALIAPLVDQYRVMCYDMFCPPSLFVGPTSTAPWARDGMRYIAEMVPKHKLIMGLPTYGVDWDMNDPKQSRQVNDAAFAAACEQCSPIGRGWVFYWDVNLIRYTDDAGHEHLFWISDAMSTRSHLETVEELDLAGISFWCLMGDEDPDIYRAVRERLRR